MSGQIAAGKYSIENVPPGRKIVLITSVKQYHFPKSHAEMAEMAKRGPPPTQETADEVPANAQGNNASIETTQGVQQFNFDLKPPSGDARIDGAAYRGGRSTRLGFAWRKNEVNYC